MEKQDSHTWAQWKKASSMVEEWRAQGFEVEDRMRDKEHDSSSQRVDTGNLLKRKIDKKQMFS